MSIQVRFIDGLGQKLYWAVISNDNVLKYFETKDDAEDYIRRHQNNQ